MGPVNVSEVGDLFEDLMLSEIDLLLNLKPGVVFIHNVIDTLVVRHNIERLAHHILHVVLHILKVSLKSDNPAG